MPLAIPTQLRILAPILAVVLGASCGPQPAGPRSAAAPPPRFSTARPLDLPDQLTLPLRRQGEHLLVRTRVNGHDAGWFLFDTGSAITAIESGLAGRLGLPVTGRSVVVGVGGQQTVHLRRVKSVAVGDLQITTGDVPALKMLRLSRPMGSPLGGIVGFGQLGRLPFTIDYQSLAVTVYRPDRFRPSPSAAPHRLRVRRGLPMVAARIGNDRLVWLILDTGADNEITLPTTVLRRWPNIVAVPDSGPGQSVGVGGRQVSAGTWLRSLKLFGLDLRGVPVSFEQPPGPFDHDRMIVGRIGNKLLQHFRLTINARRGVLWAQWRPESD